MPFPIYFGYANGVSAWYGDALVAGLGVPGYAVENPYNYFVLSFWLTSGPADLALIWSEASTYLSHLGGTTQEIQLKLKKAYNDDRKKILISAFGSTDFPTSAGKDPIIVATDLATFVLENNLDGVDIDWEDNNAMNQGTGEDWLIKFQRKLR